MNPTDFIHIDLCDTEFLLRSLEPEWNALLARSSATGPFLSWEYISAWWDANKRDAGLRVLTARDLTGELRGIAPMMVARGWRGVRRGFQHLAFIGGIGDSMAEYQEFIVEAGFEKKVAPLFCEALLRKQGGDWDVLHCPVIPADSLVLGAMSRRLDELGTPARIIGRRCAAWGRLPATFEEFESAMSRSFRSRLNNRRNAVEKHHSSAWRMATSPADAHQMLDTMAALARARWGSDSLAYHTPEFMDLHRELANRLLPTGGMELIELSLEGRPAAVACFFVRGRHAYVFQILWDPGHSELALGNVLISEVVRHCIEVRRLTHIDFMASPGDDVGWKSHWTTEKAPLVDIEIPNPDRLRGSAFGLLRSVKTWHDTRPMRATTVLSSSL